MKNLLLLLIFALTHSYTLAQDIANDFLPIRKLSNNGLFKRKNPRKLNPMGVGLSLLGPSKFLSAEIDYFVLPYANIMAGVSMSNSYLGVKYHYKGNTGKRITKYVGLYALMDNTQYQTFNYIPDSYYMPLGLQYLSKKGKTISLEFGGILKNQKLTPKLGINIAYHFRVLPKSK